MSYQIALLPGDGIGPEVIGAARTVLEATGLPLSFTTHPVGWGCFETLGTALPDATLAAVRAADATLLGAVGSPSTPVVGYRSPVVALRQALELFVCLRPVHTPPLPDARPGVDLVVIRENTEGLYAGRERQSADKAVTERVITRAASARLAHWTVDYARTHGRQRITVVHKANVLRATCGLFRTTVLPILQADPNLVVDELLVDTAAYQLVRDPARFDLIMTTNLFGDILSDVASAWGGGLGLAVSANLGTTAAIFEPVHGSAPDIAGQGRANPLAAIGAAAMLLEHLGEQAAATAIRAACNATLAQGVLTPDLGGTATTAMVLDTVLNQLNSSIGVLS